MTLSQNFPPAQLRHCPKAAWWGLVASGAQGERPVQNKREARATGRGLLG